MIIIQHPIAIRKLVHLIKGTIAFAIQRSKMLKFAILLSIFFNNAYAYAGFIAPIARQAYAGSGLTDEQIFEDERMWSVKKQTNTMKMLENPEKKPSDPEVMPGVIKSKISTENLFSYCHGRVFKREQVKLALLGTVVFLHSHLIKK